MQVSPFPFGLAARLLKIASDLLIAMQSLPVHLGRRCHDYIERGHSNVQTRGQVSMSLEEAASLRYTL